MAKKNIALKNLLVIQKTCSFTEDIGFTQENTWLMISDFS
jgi:hypothetical protein